MRALLLVSALDGTGPGRVMATLAGELRSFGVTPMLVATHGPQRSSLIEEVQAADIRVANLEMRQMWDPVGPARLLALARKWRPHVVHTRTIRADLVGRFARILGIPVITNVVNVYPDDCLAQHRPLVARAVMTITRSTRRATSLFVANAEAVAANTVTAFGVPGPRVRVIYDGIRLERWQAPAADLTQEGVAADDIVCLTVGRLHPQKGLEDLVDAASEVLDHRPGVRFVVIGAGPLRAELTSRIRSVGLEGKLLLLGHRDDVAALLARADLFVLPSRFEGLPSAVIEAMAAGLPVVATAVAGVPELVDHEVTGWLVPPASPSALARAVLGALASDLVGKGEAGRAKAARVFSAPRMGAAFATLYDEVVGTSLLLRDTNETLKGTTDGAGRSRSQGSDVGRRGSRLRGSPTMWWR